MTHQKIPDARDIDGEGLIIREGHRYQARNGDVHGPIRPSGDRQYPWEDTLSSWTETGRWIGSDDDSEFDLIAEVAPPSPAAVEHVERGEEGRFAKFAPERRAEVPDDAPTEFHKLTTRELIEEAGRRPSPKTLRDEFAMAALTGLCVHEKAEDYDDTAEYAYRYADALRARTVTRTGDR